MLRVENLTKVYDDGTVALRDVSFEVPDGQFLAVVGLSGSGKSTLLRCINRLIEPTEGEIWWEGRDLLKLPENEMYQIRGAEIAVVFQDPMTFLNPTFTIGFQIAEALKLHQNMDDKEALEKAEGIERNRYIVHGKIHDAFMYSLIPDDLKSHVAT